MHDDQKLFIGVLQECVMQDLRNVCVLQKRKNINNSTYIEYKENGRVFSIYDCLFNLKENLHSIVEYNHCIQITWRVGQREFILGVYEDGDVCLEEMGRWTMVLYKDYCQIFFFEGGYYNENHNLVDFSQVYENTFKNNTKEYAMVECIIHSIITCHRMIFLGK
ncbi:hypothetical protein phiOC_p363 [Ochrobactrum phage vB_OspM_OC]|nr:hypothetical protein phiOC_p363 [Ochrobactrum phage vB_OspM_OC]